MSHDSNKWEQQNAPPPPLFLGKKERDLVKQVNDELIERVIGQRILYFPVDLGSTEFHQLYGEAVHKSFLPPVHCHVLVDWEGHETTTTQYGVDRRAKIKVHFFKKRVTEDQDLYVREGDFVKYGDDFYEIMTLEEPTELFGRTEHKVEILANCLKARKGLFKVKSK